MEGMHRSEDLKRINTMDIDFNKLNGIPMRIIIQILVLHLCSITSLSLVLPDVKTWIFASVTQR